MSWLKKLILDPPLPVGADLIYDEVERFVGEFDRQWELRAAREEQLLLSHRLPIPRREPLTYNIEQDRVQVNPPTFSLPPHLCYDAFRQGETRSGTPEPLRREWMMYVIIRNTEEEISEARNLLETEGIVHVLDLKLGRWFNRNPYEMYEFALENWVKGWFKPSRDGASEIRHHIKKISNKPSAIQMAYSSDTPGEPASLHQVAGYTPDDMERFQERLEFVNRMAPVLTYTSPFPHLKITSPAEGKREGFHLSDDILFSLQMPTPDYPNERVVVKLLPPRTVKAAANKEFFSSLQTARHPISFELIDTGETAYFQLAYGKADQALIDRQLELHFPDCARLAGEDGKGPSKFLRGIRVQLAYMFNDGPAVTSFGLDPLSQFFSVMNSVAAGNTAALQVVFWPFPRTLLTSITREFWPRVIFEQYDKKQPVWMVSVYLLASSHDLLRQLKSAFLTQYIAQGNKWILVEGAVHFKWRWVQTDMILSSQELAAFAHFPITELNCERLETASMKQKLPPETYTTGGVAIGSSEARGLKKAVTLPESARDRHVYVVGKSGTGKSTLIFNAAVQNILRGDGVAVIDPHGDLVSSGEHGLLHYIPEERIKDTIYLNAADKEHPISMNLMAVSNDEELDLLAANLQTTFRRLSDSWGERMDNLLRFALHTLVQTQGSTFFDLKRLLQNAEYRKSVVSRLTDDRLVDFWQNDFAAYRDSIQPIISRMGKFMLSPLHGMLSQPKSKLNFYDLIQQKKILLVNLGGIGEDDAQLLGSLLVSQLQLAVMQRAKLSPQHRHPYYLYVDEFQNFTSRAFAKILSEARKYQLCLTLAHQFISQLGENERDAIFGNIGTMIMFGVGDKDAQTLRHQLGKYEPIDLANLPKYHALCRPEQANDTFLFITSPPPPRAKGFAERITEHTRATYASKPIALERPALADTQPKQEEHKPIQAGADELISSARVTTQPVVHNSEDFMIPRVPEETRIEPQRNASPPTPALGRGGQQHKYLQQLIKRLAEDKGYRVIIEEPVLAGIGSVDVTLERKGHRIACEISVSSTSDYEFRNIQKCLAAGFDEVVVLSSEKRALMKIQKLADNEFDATTNQKVRFFLPEEFVQFLEETDTEQSSAEETVRGYKVKVKYKAGGDTKQKAQRQAIAQVILQALKRLKDES